jgi:hypothetical protein
LLEGEMDETSWNKKNRAKHVRYDLFFCAEDKQHFSFYFFGWTRPCETCAVLTVISLGFSLGLHRGWVTFCPYTRGSGIDGV